ncbi:MAG: restriction endonuclease subunit S [Sandaracinaceae bacterium]|nr:restriction endonuclease subunit S [Sandaracinaceae bacterium]
MEWLGEIPDSWTAVPLRTAARLESGHTPSRTHPEYWEDCTVPWFTLADVWQIREAGRRVILETKEKVSELGLTNSAARRLPAGTVMLSRTASVGFGAIMGVEMATTQDFANWVCGHRLRPLFLLHCLSAMTGEFERLRMGSVHNTIYMPDIRALRIALPPPPEQDGIVAFLDRETAKLDALIAEQQRLIELLKEKRQAVISHAVTKGLDPGVPMKDSGIEWLGRVPKHWQLAKLGRYATVENGTTPSRRDPGHWDGDVAWLASGSVNQRRVREPSGHITMRALSECSLRLLPIGAVVVGMIGQGKTRGLAAVLEIPATINQNLAAIVPGDRLDSEFLLSVFDTAYDDLRELGRGGNQAALNTEILSSYRVPLPPLAEQEEIARHLRIRVDRYDELTRESDRAIALLRERRTALITAAVTGQIDVRGLAATEAA